jgi:hypothetical protein
MFQKTMHKSYDASRKYLNLGGVGYVWKRIFITGAGFENPYCNDARATGIFEINR